MSADARHRWGRGLYPLAAGGGLAVAVLVHGSGGPVEAAVLAWSAAVFLLGLWLERRHPFDRSVRRPLGDGPTDALSAAVLIGLVDPLLKLALPALALGLLALGPVAGPLAHPQGVWAQALTVLLALLWMDGAKYAMHRAHHRWPPLWRLHALHHSAERLHSLDNFRFHPLNHALNQLAALLPLHLLGVPAELLWLAQAPLLPVVMLQHANADLPLGGWNRVFSTFALHRWHHSAQPLEANANFGSALALWDRLFGSWRLPPARRGPQAIGLFGGHRFPARAGYWTQLMAGLACCPR